MGDKAIWDMRTANRAMLIAYIGHRLSMQRSAAVWPPEAMASARRMFDPSALTIGFARRFATYKRVVSRNSNGSCGRLPACLRYRHC